MVALGASSDHNLIMTTISIDPRHALWQKLTASRLTTETNAPNHLLECTLVVDNAKSHYELQQRPYASTPNLPLLSSRKLSARRLSRRPARASSSMDRHSDNNRSMSRFSSFPSNKKATTCSADTITVNNIARQNRQPGSCLRRSHSSDGITTNNNKQDALERWLAMEQQASGNTWKSLRRGTSVFCANPDNDCGDDDDHESSDDGRTSSSDDDDNDEPPLHACVNAHKPMRQASQDPEDVRRLVERMRLGFN